MGQGVSLEQLEQLENWSKRPPSDRPFWGPANWKVEGAITLFDQKAHDLQKSFKQVKKIRAMPGCIWHVGLISEKSFIQVS